MYCGGVKLKNEMLKFIGLMICLVFVFSSIPQSAAAVVWEDDFNDGNYDGWTVEVGDWDASSYALTGDASAWVIRIWRPCNQTTGTWSFDYLNIVDGPDAYWGDFFCYYNVHFMTSGCAASPGCNISGYSVQFFEDVIYILRYDDYYPVLLKMALLEGQWGTSTRYDITRDATGTIRVYANATSPDAEPVIEAVDTTYSNSEKFVIDVEYNNYPYFLSSIDNIVVDDEFGYSTTTATTTTTTTTTTEPPTPTDPGNGEPFVMDPMILAVGGGAIVLVLVLVVIAKRK
jgi:hypothetical protein